MYASYTDAYWSIFLYKQTFFPLYRTPRCIFASVKNCNMQRVLVNNYNWSNCLIFIFIIK